MDKLRNPDLSARFCSACHSTRVFHEYVSESSRKSCIRRRGDPRLHPKIHHCINYRVMQGGGIVPETQQGAHPRLLQGELTTPECDISELPRSKISFMDVRMHRHTVTTSGTTTGCPHLISILSCPALFPAITSKGVRFRRVPRVQSVHDVRVLSLRWRLDWSSDSVSFSSKLNTDFCSSSGSKDAPKACFCSLRTHVHYGASLLSYSCAITNAREE